MTNQARSDNEKIERIVATYNTLPNLVWTVLSLVPVYIFSARFMPLKLVYIFAAISIIGFFLPAAFFNKIQLSKSSKFYERLGIRFIKKFAQNGELIQRLIKGKYPGYKCVTVREGSIEKLVGQTYFFEKFHFALFLFFFAINVYAAESGMHVWSVILLLCNLLYNVYPNLLQQYIRVKLGRKEKNIKYEV